jgi:hypothetical protein
MLLLLLLWIVGQPLAVVEQLLLLLLLQAAQKCSNAVRCKLLLLLPAERHRQLCSSCWHCALLLPAGARPPWHQVQRDRKIVIAVITCCCWRCKRKQHKKGQVDLSKRTCNGDML